MLGRILAVVRREWAELGRNRVVLVSVIVPPLLFVAFPLAGLYGGVVPYLAENTPQLEGLRRAIPELGGLDDRQAIEILLLGQSLGLLLLAPVSAALTIASYSIVGEKQQRTLEPLLASPIRSSELLLAKTLAAALPSIGAGWLAYSILVVAAAPGLTRTALSYLLGPTGLLLIVVLAPLVALLGVGLAVLASARADDPRAAQQLGVLIVLPLLGLLFAQATGLIYLGPGVVLAASLAAALVNVGLLAVAARLFEREAILTRWH